MKLYLFGATWDVNFSPFFEQIFKIVCKEKISFKYKNIFYILYFYILKAGNWKYRVDEDIKCYELSIIYDFRFFLFELVPIQEVAWNGSYFFVAVIEQQDEF